MRCDGTLCTQAQSYHWNFSSTSATRNSPRLKAQGDCMVWVLLLHEAWWCVAKWYPPNSYNPSHAKAHPGPKPVCGDPDVPVQDNGTSSPSSSLVVSVTSFTNILIGWLDDAPWQPSPVPPRFPYRFLSWKQHRLPCRRNVRNDLAGIEQHQEVQGSLVGATFAPMNVDGRNPASWMHKLDV